MEGFRSAVLSVCLVSGGICAVRSLVSGNSLRIRLELILKMFFAIALISPFVKGSLAFELPQLSDFELSDYSFQQEEYNAEITRQTSENIAQILREQLSAAGYSCGEISVEINISDESRITISKVTVSAEDFAGAAEVIRKCLGAETEVADGNSE